MNVHHAIDGLIAKLIANLDQVNANARLAASGYQLTAEPETAAGDSSAYRYIKKGDRLSLHDGLTVCFIAGSSPDVGGFTPAWREKRAQVQILCYVIGPPPTVQEKGGGDVTTPASGGKDPAKVEEARGGIAEALRGLFNREPWTLVTPAGTFYDTKVTDEQFRYYERIQAANGRPVAAAGVMLPWQGLFYVQETTTSG